MATEPLKILAIDDNADNLTTLQAVLADTFPQAKVVTALNGPAGLDLARAEDPGVILLDILMPGMDGYAVCRALKADERLKSIPVVFLTAQKTDRHSRVQALEAGAEAFLAKPLEEEELTAQILAMVKIGALQRHQRQEKEQLATLVAERTAELTARTFELEQELARRHTTEQTLRREHQQLQESQAATLTALENLKAEVDARKQAEAALRVNEEFLRNLLEHAPVSVYVTAADGRLRLVNQRWETETARPRTEALGRPLEEIYIAATARKLRADNQKVLETDASLVFEEVIEAPIEPHHFYTAKFPLHDAQGRVEAVGGLSIDITERVRSEQERRRAEEALRASEVRFEQVVASIPDHIYVSEIRGEGQVVNVYHSTQVEELTGYPRQRFMDEWSFWLETVIHPADREAARAQVARLLAGQASQMEYRVQRADGDVIWVRDSARVETTPAGVQTIYGVVIDITERVRSEQARRQTAEALRIKDWAITAALNAIAIADLEGNLTYVNPAFLKMWGYDSQAEVLDRAAADFWQAAARPSEVITALQIRGNWEGELTAYRGKDRRPFEIQVSASMVMNDAGQPICMLAAFQDITLRKQAEQRLHQTLERLDLATRAARLGIWDWDITSNELVWDDRMYELYGVKRADFASAYEAWLASLHPEDRAASDEASRQARSGEKEYDTEFRVVWPDGAVRVLKAYGQVVRDAAGQPLRMTGINYDITEQKLAEEALRENEERLRLITDNMVDLIAQFDAQAFFQYVSPSYEKILGYRAEDLVGKSATDFLHPDKRDEIIQTIDAMVRLGTGAVQFRYRHKDGSYRWIESAGRNLLNADGQVIGSTMSSRDITERKQAEEALRASEARYRALFNSMTEGFAVHEIVCDANGQPCDYRFLDVNLAFERLTGLKRENLIGHLYSHILPDEDPFWLETYGRVALTGESVHFEHYSPPLQRHYEVFAYRPAPSQFAVIFVDITARKQVEEALRQLNAELEQRVEVRTAQLNTTNQELVAAIRAKDEFLAGMSHELRTPLTAILGLAESLQLKFHGPLTDKQLQYVQVIHQSGEHLLELINDVLDLAKVSAGRLELQMAPVPVADVCQAVQRLLVTQASKKHITIALVSDPAVSVLQGDMRRLKQILVNLLGNAVKFTPEGGQVGLTITGDASRKLAHFCVWDTGVGIAAEDLPRLFQDFVQLDARLAREYEGTGLGLAMVRRLAELHGGQVKAESDGPGKGSRFTVSLPWEPAASAPKLRAKPEKPIDIGLPVSGAPKTDEAPLILVVDDQPALLLAVQGILLGLAYRVETLDDSRKALAQAQTLRPALMLVDIQMPHIDGLTLIRQMRADPALAAMPIIALTALAMPGDRERCLEAGATEYLSKPVKLDELATTVKRLLEA